MGTKGFSSYNLTFVKTWFHDSNIIILMFEYVSLPQAYRHELTESFVGVYIQTTVKSLI